MHKYTYTAHVTTAAPQWYRAALCMLPQQPGTLSALGFTLQLMGRCEEAAEVCGQEATSFRNSKRVDVLANLHAAAHGAL